MTKFITRYIGIVLFFAPAVLLFAQEVQISFAEGGDFSLSSGGKRTTYRADRMNAEGVSLRNEDILQTGAGSFVELRLEPSGTRIKIAENTSLVCKGGGPEGSSLRFALLYGRIRLSTVGGWSPDIGIPVFINAGQAETVFRQGDAGVDYLYDAATAEASPLGKTEPVMRIYGFSGNVAVLPASDTTVESRPYLPVSDYESVTIEAMNPFSFIERKPVEDSIIQYWNHHNFSGSSRLLDPRTPTIAAPVVVPVPPPPREVERQIEWIQSPYDNELMARNIMLGKVKNSLIITSVVFLAGGISTQLAGQYRWNNMGSDLGDTLVNYGYTQLGVGFFLAASSLFVNQRNPTLNAAK